MYNIFIFFPSEFGQHAVDLLDLSYKDSALHAIASLDDKLPEFGNKTVTQVAQLCRNKYFIAHKSCQKWMNHRWHGILRIREVDYRIFKLPEYVKVNKLLIDYSIYASTFKRDFMLIFLYTHRSTSAFCLSFLCSFGSPMTLRKMV